MKPCRWIPRAGAARAAAACLVVLSCQAVLAAPPPEPFEWSAEEIPDALPLAAQAAKAAKAQADTTWIADWTFDAAGGGCDDTGWTKIDNRIRNDGSNYWSVGDRFDGQGGINGRAAILAKHDLCWANPDGYGNNWDYSIILKYRGAGSTLSFRFLSDAEPGYDFVTVEADSGGASESLVNFQYNPEDSPAEHRDELYSLSGPEANGAVTGLTLPLYGVPAVTHEVYIRLASDGGYSDEDGLYLSAFGAGLVVDDIQVTGDLAYTESFEGVLGENVTLANTASATPFGEWARLYQHITDNDRCNENTTCAWLWTDPHWPAFSSSMAFGPGGAVVRNWLDDIIVSPWVSLGTTPIATRTVFSMRRFPGNIFAYGNIVQNWSVRSKARVDNTDSSTPGDSIECLSWWGHSSSWNSLTSFVWATNVWDMSSYVMPGAAEIQIRLRVSDFKYIAGSQWWGSDPGPGPYNDRLRIGRQVVPGPVLSVGTDARSQAQDCFPTLHNGILPGEHFSPSTDRFGSCAFSAGADLGLDYPYTWTVITGDSIWVTATDTRGAGGVTSVRWYGAVVAGPHAGKAPPPYTAGTNGFFGVVADSCRTAAGTAVAGAFCVDLDDGYFRGGDVLHYFWYATDAAGGGASLPEGITSASFPPLSVGAAEIACNGLLEASFLPTIRWDAGYRARIAVDPHGDLEPTPAELANSEQARCILYYQHVTAARRSGQSQRTAFMYTLDRLGYSGWYDVYDVQGYGNTNNQLAGRATIPQVSGYALLIEDNGRSNLSPNLPDGSNVNSQKVNQAQWYRDYLAQGATGLAGRASLWILGESTAYEKRTNSLFAVDMGAGTVVNDQGVAVNPDVVGVGSYTFWDGRVASFTGDRFSLVGGCPTQRNFDAYTPSGTAVATHQYSFTGPLGPITGAGAVLVNSNATQHWNTVLIGFAWGDVADAFGTSPGGVGPEIELAGKILDCVVPLECRLPPGQTGVTPPEAAGLPRVTALHPNVPNPFNPVTVIRFDLAQAGRVQLAIYDAAGRRVRELVAGEMPAGWHRAAWDGLDARGQRAASGVYFCRLSAPDLVATRKLLLLE